MLVSPGCSRFFGPRATLGPGAIVRGRGLYNEVINETNNQQTLDLIVHARYGEPWSVMSVGSVTANLRAGTTSEAQFGIGPDSNFKGNLVPLAVGLAYEENPTIAYTPVQGERYAKSLLSPLGLDTLVLLLGVERPPDRLLSVLVKQVNGLRNPVYGPPEAHTGFDESVALLARLDDAGQATWTATSTKTKGAEPSFALVLHDYAPGNRDAVHELLARWGLPGALARDDRDVVLPVRLAFGTTTTPALNVQTRSVFDLIQIAACSVDVPAEHATAGLSDATLGECASRGRLLRIQSSADRPSTDVLVAVRHHGYWFYVAANDGPSKLAFRLLHMLIGMRLAEVTPQSLPALTIPAAR